MSRHMIPASCRRMSAVLSATCAALWAGCGDHGVQTYNTAPEIAIVAGPAGATYLPDDTFEVEALASDQEDPPADLVVHVALDGEDLGEEIPAEDGSVWVEISAADHEAGEHTVTLTVLDTDGASASASDTFTIGASEAPAATILAPGEDDLVCVGDTVLLEGEASDADDPAGSLLASWESSLDGELASGAEVGADGLTSSAAVFDTAGEHMLTLTVVDPHGSDGSDSMLLTLLSEEDCNEAPTVTITSPVDGDAFTAGDSIAFAGSAADAEDDPEDLTITWSSSIDGVLDTTPADGSGAVGFDTGALAAGLHDITLSAEDSLGNMAGTTIAIEVCDDADGDGTGTCTGDCDDTEPTVGPGAAEVCDGLDNDCDGIVPSDETDADGDGVLLCDGDCDDTSADVYPGAPEICDGLDNDCDGLIPADETDDDGDGHAGCDGDCDDTAADVHPGATELCDGLDNDCDGAVAGTELDDDGDGYAECEGDCDDADPAFHPGAAELCDGLDNDCDGMVQPGETDDDGDGFAECDGDCDDTDASAHPNAVEACDGVDNDCDGQVPADEDDDDGDGHAECEGDCDDTEPLVHPGAAELCDGLDNDCDGVVPADEDDGDGDGIPACAGDCDDGDATVYPGAFELCDGLDNDCDGVVPADEDDGDGDGVTGCGGDCDDTDAAVHPGATEVCNGVDDDCDGVIPADEDDVDADGVRVCEGDCDDADPAVNPGEVEICNFVDDDCDGDVDEGFDVDGDGYTVCDGDCDDGADDVYPGAPEPCDGVDHDCDGVPGGNDADGDGVCDADDVCPGHDDNQDLDGDGIPDGCDADAELDVYVGGSYPDHDVAADGFMAVVRGSANEILVTCYEPDRTLRKAEFAVGEYDSTNAIGIFVSRDSQKVFVAWRDYSGGLDSLEYAYLDSDCNVVVPETAVWGPESNYFEFFDAAIDDDGYVVLAYSNGETEVAWIDDDGAVLATEEAFDIGAVYGTHVALNQDTGAGMVAAQVHSGNGIYYRRFDAGWSWVDASAQQVSVNYHYWYDGFTVGMNDSDEWVLLWRSDGDQLDMKFFDANATEVASVTRTTPDFEGWNGGHCYDSFRRRHQEVPLRGDNFVLGEVYNWIAGDNLEVYHFEYTPTGSLVTEDSTTYSADEGLTIRLDEVGYTYLRDETTVTIVSAYP